jgi:hypothetical protein
MTAVNYEGQRYSVCIAYEAPDRIKFFRVADYHPDDAEEGNELVRPLFASDFDEWKDRYANPDTVHCGEAYAKFANRKSDVYLLEWRVDPHDHRKQISQICRGFDGLPSSDDIREVIDVPGVSCREDLVKLLQHGYYLKGIPTREFYLVYERHGGYQRYAVKCKRDDFVSGDCVLRLQDAYSNTRQSVLTAPIVVLPETKIIQTIDFPELGGREIYTGLGELVEEEGSLLLRPAKFFARDYVRHYCDHCQTVDKLTDKERRYAVSRAIDEALSRPNEIEKYLGAECPEEELAELRSAILMQLEGQSDDTIELFENVLIENDTVRDECVRIAKERNKELFEEDEKKARKLRDEIARAEERKIGLEDEVSEVEARAAALKNEAAEAEKKLFEATEKGQQVTQELEDNLALKLGLGAVSRAVVDAGGTSVSSGSIIVESGSRATCEELNAALNEVISENLKRLGVVADSVWLRQAAASIAGACESHMPLAVPEPLAVPVAKALGAALYSSTPVRVVVPADCHDIGRVASALSEPGVFLVDGVIDSANESVLFAMLRKWECSTVVFSFRSHASARLIAREAWDGMFMPCVETLAWAPFFSRGTTLATIKSTYTMRSQKRRYINDKAKDLSESLSGLRLPSTSFLLPAAVALAAEDDCGEECYEAVVAQHLAMASGADSIALETLDEWTSRAGAEPWLDEFRMRLGLTDE